MKKRNAWILFLCFVWLAAALTACGGRKDGEGGSLEGNPKGTDAETADPGEEGRWAYVPEFLEMGEVPYGQVLLFGNDLYYFEEPEAVAPETENLEEAAESSPWILHRISLGTEDDPEEENPEEEAFQGKKETSKEELSWEAGDSTLILRRADGAAVDGEWEVCAFAAAEEGNLYLILQRADSADGAEEKAFFCKFDREGKEVFEKEIPSSQYTWFLQADGAGNVCAASGNTAFCFDEEGAQKGSLSLENENCRISGLGRSRAGKFYAAYYESEETGGFFIIGNASDQLVELDFEGQEASKVEASFSGYEVSDLFPGNEKDFLLYNGNGIYDYEIATQSAEEVLQWLDCDVNGSYARLLGVTEEGKIAAACRSDFGGETEIVLLARTKLTDDQEKQTLRLGTLSPEDSTLRASVVNFNKKNDKYRIEIQSFYDSASGESYEDARTNFQNAILSGDCPDLIDLSGLDVTLFASKGVFADLSPYLENSGVLKREDFLENILEAYTIGGCLTAIPYRFSVSSVVGCAADLQGADWTLDGVIAYADAHPEAELFNYSRKSSILEFLLTFGQEAFWNRETGECRFDSEEFQRLLQFVGRFPDTVEIPDGAQAGPARIQAGEVLLTTAFETGLNSFQTYQEMYQPFGGAVYIGYPTADGSGGHRISNVYQTYGISSKSALQEGAWAFLESILTQEKASSFSFGFPTLKRALDRMVREALFSGYELDEEGNPILDEEGNPVPSITAQGTYWSDGWTYTFRAPTQEEIDAVLDMIRKARLVPGDDDEILKIIDEEAEAFFQGQKSAEEVARVIQGRASMYASERQ